MDAKDWRDFEKLNQRNGIAKLPTVYKTITNQPTEQLMRKVRSQLVSQQLKITKYKTINFFTYVRVHGKSSFLRSKLIFSWLRISCCYETSSLITVTTEARPLDLNHFTSDHLPNYWLWSAALWCGVVRRPTFRNNVSPPPSGSESKLTRNQTKQAGYDLETSHAFVIYK